MQEGGISLDGGDVVSCPGANVALWMDIVLCMPFSSMINV